MTLLKKEAGFRKCKKGGHSPVSSWYELTDTSCLYFSSTSSCFSSQPTLLCAGVFTTSSSLHLSWILSTSLMHFFLPPSLLLEKISGSTLFQALYQAITNRFCEAHINVFIIFNNLGCKPLQNRNIGWKYLSTARLLRSKWNYMWQTACANQHYTLELGD